MKENSDKKRLTDSGFDSAISRPMPLHKSRYINKGS
jgi:hypothetical protein